MTTLSGRSLLLAALALLVFALPAQAQIYESVGTRAQGMSGAFVAVADDATASWWNPAGIATGALLNAVFDKVKVTEPSEPIGLGVAHQSSTSGFAFAMPALGLSYYRVRLHDVLPPATGPSAPARQDDEGVTRVRALKFRQFGTTVGQSVGAHIVVASTMKLMWGGVAEAPANNASDGLDQAEDLTPDSAFQADLDLGAMVSFTHIRIGISARNMTTPEFGEGDLRTELERQARAGLALLSGPLGPVERVTVGFDADLTRTPSIFGDLRHAAAGVEVMFAGRRLAVRGGLARNTAGLEQSSTSTGVSFAPVRGIFIEAARSFGADESLRGWSSSVRVTF